MSHPGPFTYTSARYGNQQTSVHTSLKEALGAAASDHAEGTAKLTLGLRELTHKQR